MVVLVVWKVYSNWIYVLSIAFLCILCKSLITPRLQNGMDYLGQPSAKPNNMPPLNCCKNSCYILLGCHGFFFFALCINITSNNLTVLASPIILPIFATLNCKTSLLCALSESVVLAEMLQILGGLYWHDTLEILRKPVGCLKSY